ncbi:hypothetical protein L5D93_25410 [Paenibacillus thiaminolyticus]|nr:hypothetical protein [Paenibacillus thiaminolyticus]
MDGSYFWGKGSLKGGGSTLPKVNAKTPVPKVEARTSAKINKPKYGVVPQGGGATVNWGQAKTVIKEGWEAFQKSAGQLSKNKLAYDGPNANYKSSTQKPLEPTKNQIEVRKSYPGSDPKNSASGSTPGKNKNSSGKGTGNDAYGGYYERKDFRTKIYNAEYTPHGHKHLKAKTAEEAKRFSETGDKNAQYLPDANNKIIEKEALSNGHIIDNGNNNYYFIYDTGKVIGYDNGIPTQWIRAELKYIPRASDSRS